MKVIVRLYSIQLGIIIEAGGIKEENMKIRALKVVEMQQDFEVSNMSKEKLTVLKGTKGRVNSRGNVKLLEGELRGKLLPRTMFDFEVEGIDFNQLSQLIFQRLDYYLPSFDEYMDDYEIEKKDVINEIEAMLYDELI